jgi:hypothetical protein
MIMRGIFKFGEPIGQRLFFGRSISREAYVADEKGTSTIYQELRSLAGRKLILLVNFNGRLSTSFLAENLAISESGPSLNVQCYLI